MALGKVAGEVLIQMHFQWVNPTTLFVAAKVLGLVATALPEWFVWCKLAICVRLYMAKGSKEIERATKGMGQSVAIKPSHLEALSKEAYAPQLQAIEDFLVGVYQKYDSLQGVPVIDKMAGQHQTLSRVGSLLRDKKDVLGDQKLLASIEAKLRDQLQRTVKTVQLPPPIFADASVQAPVKAKKASTSEVQPISLSAPVAAKDGAFVADAAFSLAKEGFVTGAEVVASKPVQKLATGSKGSIVGITDGGRLQVVWQNGSFTDGSDHSAAKTTIIDKAAVFIAKPDEKPAAPVAKKAKTQESIMWTHADSKAAAASLVSLARALLCQAHLCSAPGPDDIELVSKPRAAIAKKDFPALTLVLVPQTQDVAECSDKDPADGPMEKMQVKMPRAIPLKLRLLPGPTGGTTAKQQAGGGFQPIRFQSFPIGFCGLQTCSVAVMHV